MYRMAINMSYSKTHLTIVYSKAPYPIHALVRDVNIRKNAFYSNIHAIVVIGFLAGADFYIFYRIDVDRYAC